MRRIPARRRRSEWRLKRDGGERDARTTHATTEGPPPPEHMRLRQVSVHRKREGAAFAGRRRGCRRRTHVDVSNLFGGVVEHSHDSLRLGDGAVALPVSSHEGPSRGCERGQVGAARAAKTTRGRLSIPNIAGKAWCCHEGRRTTPCLQRLRRKPESVGWFTGTQNQTQNKRGQTQRQSSDSQPWEPSASKAKTCSRLEANSKRRSRRRVHFGLSRQRQQGHSSEPCKCCLVRGCLKQPKPTNDCYRYQQAKLPDRRWSRPKIAKAKRVQISRVSTLQTSPRRRAASIEQGAGSKQETQDTCPRNTRIKQQILLLTSERETDI